MNLINFVFLLVYEHFLTEKKSIRALPGTSEFLWDSIQRRRAVGQKQKTSWAALERWNITQQPFGGANDAAAHQPKMTLVWSGRANRALI
jgi:hypothetical protein